MMLIGAPHLEFLQCVDMALINLFKGRLYKCDVLTLTSVPFTQCTVNLSMGMTFRSIIYEIKEKTNGCSYKHDHRFKEFWFWAGFITRNKDLWMHSSKRVCLLEKLFAQDGHDNRVVKRIPKVELF